MDLRDRFASRFAAALVDAFSDPDRIAARAYDLAEAMLRERDKRIDADEGAAIALEPRRQSLFPLELAGDDAVYMPELEGFEMHRHAGLLDEPEPMEPETEIFDEDALPAWLEASDDPRWELEARWAPAAPVTAPTSASRPPVPGLARTQPEVVDEERPARSGRSA